MGWFKTEKARGISNAREGPDGLNSDSMLSLRVLCVSAVNILSDVQQV